jgi:hypothetical protein
MRWPLALLSLALGCVPPRPPARPEPPREAQAAVLAVEPASSPVVEPAQSQPAPAQVIAAPSEKVIASGRPSYFLAIDEEYVYWIDTQLGLMKTSRRDGASTALGNSLGSYALGIAVDEVCIYFANSVDGSILMQPKRGGPPTVLVKGMGGIVYHIAVDKKSVYWTNHSTGEVMKLDKDGGTPVALVSSVSGATGLALDEEFVYWTNFFNGTVQKVPKGGGDVVSLATGQGSPLGITVDAGAVYWANYSGGTIMRLDKKGGAPTILVEGQLGVAFLALHGAYLYWTLYGPGSGGGASGLSRAKRNGTAPGELVASGGALGVAADAQGIYWVESSAPFGPGNVRVLEGAAEVKGAR